MKAVEAAEKVLEAAGGPMNYRDIAKAMLEQGLWVTSGKTPDDTINARICEDMAQKGESSPFIRVAPGIFGLRSWSETEEIVIVSPGQGDETSANGGTTSPPDSALRFPDAAERVLKLCCNGEALHYRDLAKKIFDLRLVSTDSQCPEQRLYAEVQAEVQRAKRRGESPRFTLPGKGLIGLTQQDSPGLVSRITDHNNDQRRQFHKRLLAMPFADFEALIARLLVALGFEDVTVTSRSNDGGIDVRGTLVVADVIRTRMAVQVKRWRANVQAPTVQQVRGSLGTHEQGLIVTTSNFSKGARDEAGRVNAVPVALMNGEKLVELLVENEVGVRRESHYLLELAELEV